jgi:ParB/RepB/Spo0J family partition protein
MDLQYSAGRPLDVPPAEIVNSPTNPRKKKGLDIDSLNSMAASIRARGVMQPIIVRPLPGSRVADTAHLVPKPIYEIIAGERRWRGAVLAEILTMPVLLRDDLDDEAVHEMQLVENIEREDLDPLEEAEAFEVLRHKYGYSVEKIATKITEGKGPSYVYKRLTLNKLCKEARDAMYAEPALDVSLALLVAIYQPDDQPQVLGYLERMRDANKGQWPAFRAAKPALDEAFNTALDKVPFDIHSSELVPEAGSCVACPKRTANQRMLFDDAYTGPDSCTDAACLQTKRQAHVVLLRADLARQGLKVIEADEALRAKSGAKGVLVGFQRMDATAYTERGNDGKEREVTFADALRGMGKKAPKHRILIDPHTLEPIPVITSELAEKLLPKEPEEDKKPKPKKVKPGERPAAPAAFDERSPEEQAMANVDVQTAVLTRMFDAIRSSPRTEAELRIVVKALIIGQEGAELACQHMGFDVHAYSGDDFEREQGAWIDALPVESLGQLLTMAAIEISFGEWGGSGVSNERRIAMVSGYGIDILAVRDKVAEDLERQQGGAGGTLHPALLERLIEKAITAWKAAGTTKGKKKPEVEARLLMEVNVLRDAQADLRAGNTEEAMTELCELAGVGEFEGDGWAQIVGDELRELLAPLQQRATAEEGEEVAA